MPRSTTPADDSAEVKAPEASYPPNPKKDRPTGILVGKWKDQKRIKCCHAKCCYPLNPKKQASGGQMAEMKVPAGHDAEGERAYEAECSWDPSHKRIEDDSAQYITHLQMFPPEEESADGQ